MRCALKFAYDGQALEGYARQPEMRTVEGEVIKAMQTLGIIDNPGSNTFQSASRTDRGVSAAGNVIALDTGFDKNSLIPALNSKLDGTLFWAIAEVGEDFNARHARERWYRYILHRNSCAGPDELQTAANRFVGEHDFREYAKKDTSEEKTVLTVNSIEVTEESDFIFIDVKAQRFLWQMVRRLVSVMLDERSGPAPAENLVLMDVAYDFPFEVLVKKGTPFLEHHINARTRAETMSQIDKFITSS
jgi:tRNA pseudouridine38-40 synthase